MLSHYYSKFTRTGIALYATADAIILIWHPLATIQAAEDRRQEKIPQDCEVNKQYYLGGGPARSSSLTTNIKVGSTQNSDGSQRAIPGSLTDGVGSASGNGVPKRRLSSSKSHVLRLPSPKPSKEHILKASKTDVDQPTAVDISVGHVDYEEAEPPLLLATIGKYGSSAGKYGSGLTSPNLPLPRRNRSSHAVDGITSVGSGPTEEPFDRTSDDDEGGHCALNKPTSRARAVISNDVDRNADGGGVRHAVIQHGRRAGHSSTASSPDPPPPLAEIFEARFDFIFLPVNVFAGTTVMVILFFDVLCEGSFKLRRDSPRVISLKRVALLPLSVGHPPANILVNSGGA